MEPKKFPITKHSKRYWLEHVYKPEIQRADGTKSVSDNYAVYLCHAGQKRRLSLGTPNQAQAAELARDCLSRRAVEDQLARVLPRLAQLAVPG